jgi:hypothetical protein
MFILVDKINKKIIASSSKKAISEESGINVHTLSYYASKQYYENLNIIFAKIILIKSKQGGFRPKKAEL